MRHILLGILIAIGAQAQVADSLRNVIATSDNDTVVVEALLNLALEIYLSDPDSAITVCLEAMEISEAKDLVDGRSFSYAWLGYLYEVKGDIDRSLDYQFRSLVLFEELNDIESQAGVLNNIGTVYSIQGDNEKALVYFERSLELKRELADPSAIALSIHNIAFIHDMNEDNELAMDMYEESLELYESVSDTFGIAMVITNIGTLLEEFDEHDRALELYMEGLMLREAIDDKEGIAVSLYTISKLYNTYGDVGSALSYALRSLKVAEEVDFTENIKDAAGLLDTLYFQQGNWQKAYEMYKLFVCSRDTLLSDENHRASIQLDLQYEYEKNYIADSLEFLRQQEREALEHDAELQQEENRRYWAYGGIGFVLVLGLVLGMGYVRKRRDNMIIREQKQEVELQRDMIHEKNTEILDSINYARRLQEAILPPRRVVKEYLENSFILYKPKDIVAGDFYWMETVEDTIYIAAADCTGHGVPGAMVSVVCSNALTKALVEEGIKDPGKILDRAREIVIERFQRGDEEVKDGMDVSLVALKPESREILWAGANNPIWLLRAGSKGVEEIKPNKQPIGKYHVQEPFNTHSIELESGDSFYLFSDGYADQFGGSHGKKFKTRPFKELLLSIQSEPMDRQRQLIDEAFEAWRGDLEQVDDVCVIGVRV